METKECMNQIIGVARTECECFTEPLEESGLPENWWKTSTSGFFLHELDGIVRMSAVQDIISCAGLGSFYEQLIGNAIKDTALELSGAINERYRKVESDFTGFIGARSATSVLPLSSAYAGLKLSMSEKRDGVMVLKGVGTNMDTTSTFDVLIYRRYVDSNMYELVDTVEGVTSVANRYVENQLEEAIKLPMSIDNEGELEYYLIYLRNGMNPRNNLASCGCGKNEKKVQALMDYQGVNGSDIEALKAWTVNGTYAYGLVLDCEVKCDSDTTICRMAEANSDWKKFLAHAVLFKAGFKLHMAILASPEITQEIMANREQVKKNQDLFESEYFVRLKYLVQNIDLTINDCYTCNNKKMRVTQILT